MSNARRSAPVFQRNALAPGLLAGLVCLVSPFLLDWPGYGVFLYVISILALICAWFAVQARQWWWLFVFVPIAVLWNPVLPLPFSGPYWMAAHIFAGAAFILGGLMIKAERRA